MGKRKLITSTPTKSHVVETRLIDFESVQYRKR